MINWQAWTVNAINIFILKFFLFCGVGGLIWIRISHTHTDLFVRKQTDTNTQTFCLDIQTPILFVRKHTTQQTHIKNTTTHFLTSFSGCDEPDLDTSWVSKNIVGCSVRVKKNYFDYSLQINWRLVCQFYIKYIRYLSKQF